VRNADLPDVCPIKYCGRTLKGSIESEIGELVASPQEDGSRDLGLAARRIVRVALGR
jgi:hypothetical protein